MNLEAFLEQEDLKALGDYMVRFKGTAARGFHEIYLAVPALTTLACRVLVAICQPVHDLAPDEHLALQGLSQQ